MAEGRRRSSTENEVVRVCALPAGVYVAAEWFQNRCAGSDVACVDLDNASDSIGYANPRHVRREDLV